MLIFPWFYRKDLFFFPFISDFFLLVNCSSQNDYPITAYSYNYNADSVIAITIEQTSLLMDVMLRLGEFVYLEICDIRNEFYDAYKNYSNQDNSRISLLVDDSSGRKLIEYDTNDGVNTYYTKNGKNFVFYFKEFHISKNISEILFKFNQYSYL